MENQDVILAAITEHGEKFTKAQHALSVQQNEAAERLAGIEQEVAAMKGRGTYMGNVDAAPSVSGEFIKSAQMQAMRDGAPGTGRVTLKTGGIKTLTKAINNAGVGQSSGNQDYNVQPNRDVSNLWNQPQRRLSLIDALRVLPVSAAAAFEYMQLTGFTNAAAVQSKEGDTKAEQTVATTIVTSQIATVAAFVRSSLQVTEDAPQLAYQLDNLLGYGCMAKLENLLINGAGNATDRIKGLLAYATAATTSATAAADMIGEALDELDSNGWQASVIVLNPADWGAIQRERSTSNGQYILGSARNPAPPSLWSVPVVTSPSLAVGTALVLDGSQLALLDRQEVSVMSSREDGTNFTTNMVTTLAELRAGLAVFSPGAVLSVDLTPTT